MSEVRQVITYTAKHDDGAWSAMLSVGDLSILFVTAPDGRRWCRPTPWITSVGVESKVLTLIIMSITELREDPEDPDYYELLPAKELQTQ